ncbi:MAG TPA: hypothetical protein VFL03_11980 [Candidatus Limnocylindrales bacterium]|nr:hypothetical protein [Candidatus Limnocylindrales bacterium]
MRRLIALVTLLAALGVAAGIPAAAGGQTANLLKSERFVGVPKALTGAPGAIGAINGAGQPWVIGTAKAVLGVDGSLDLKFTGLLFAADAAPGLPGTNTVGSMKGAVSCLTPAGTRTAVFTSAFPVTTGSGAGAGNGHVTETLTLPSPCIAPIVLITNGTGAAWFAADGD